MATSSLRRSRARVGVALHLNQQPRACFLSTPTRPATYHRAPPACSILHRLVRRRAFPESLVSPPSIPSTFSASIVRPSLTSLRILRQTPHLEPKDRRTGLCLNPPVYSSRDVALNGARCLVPHRPFSTLTCKPHPRKSHLPFSQDCTPCAPGLRRARSRRCWPLIASPALAGIPGPQGDIFPLALPSISVPHVSCPHLFVLIPPTERLVALTRPRSSSTNDRRARPSRWLVQLGLSRCYSDLFSANVRHRGVVYGVEGAVTGYMRVDVRLDVVERMYRFGLERKSSGGRVEAS